MRNTPVTVKVKGFMGNVIKNMQLTAVWLLVC